MEIKYYLILEKRLFCAIKNFALELIDGNWSEADYNEIGDRLIGYDASEPSDSPYKIGNSNIMAEIKKLTEEEVINKYGEDVIKKLNEFLNKK